MGGRTRTVYEVFFNSGDEEDREDFYSTSLKEVRAEAREWLLSGSEDPEQIYGDEPVPDSAPGYCDVRRLEVVVSGRGWLVNLLNRKRFVARRADVERWVMKDGKPAAVPIPGRE